MSHNIKKNGYKPVEEFPMYLINKQGSVFRLYKHRSPRERKWNYNGGGYAYVNMSDAPRLKVEYVHRLIWKTFMGDIPEDREVHHKNDIKDDNRLENLELVTRQENVHYRWYK